MATPRPGGSASPSAASLSASSRSAIPAATPAATSLRTATTVTGATASAAGPSTATPRQPRRASSGGASSKGTRRVKTQDRISDILELGRKRAESMSAARSPPGVVRRGGSTSDEARHRGEADETTEIMRHAAMNYQSTAGRDRSGNSNGSSNGSGAGGAGKGEKAWWRAKLASFGSVELENKGSVARDHLALERTFLAWLRTSLAFASIGVAITQLFRLNTSLARSPADSAGPDTLRQLGKPMGALFLGISILMLFLGYHRYLQAQRYMMLGKFPASRGTVLLVSLVALVLMVMSLVVVVVVPAQPRQG